TAGELRRQRPASLLDHRRAEVDADDLGLRVPLGERLRHDARAGAEIERVTWWWYAGQREVERPEMMLADPRLPRRREPVEHGAQRAAEEPPKGRAPHDCVGGKTSESARVDHRAARSRTISAPSSMRRSLAALPLETARARLP